MSVGFKSRLNPWYISIPSNPYLYSTKLIMTMRWQTIVSNVSIRTISPTAEAANQKGFLVGGFGRQPLYDEIGAAARNIHCYTVIGSWYWVAVGLMVRIGTLLSIVCHRIFIIILVEYRLGLLGIERYHGFKRLLNLTDTSFAYL